MRCLMSWGVLLLISLAMGCSSMILPEAEPPTFYQLQYSTEPMACDQTFNGSLLIWGFGTAAPYNRTQIVVTAANGTVRFSRKHQWVALPGALIAQMLKRDLSRGNLFPMVVTDQLNVETAYELNGRLLTFGAEKTASGWTAELTAEVSLSSKGQERLLFQELYVLHSEPFTQTDPMRFVQAMNRLAAKLSRRLRQDLCCMATDSPSS